MAKPLHLKVPEPCHENWDKMTQADKGRFCGSCQKQVVDFTGMSDAQLVAFFRKQSTGVCGRFMSDQLDRALVIPKKRIPWVKYFFQFTLPLFLGSMKSNAQKGKIDTTKTEVECRGGKAPIQYALVGDTVIMEKTETKGQVIEEKDCEPVPKAEIKTWELSPIDYKIEYTDSSFLFDTTYTFTTLGFVMPGPGLEITMPPVFPDLKEINNKIQAYPNPLRAGSPVNIKWETILTEGEDYSFQLFSTDGKVVFQKEVSVGSGTKLLNISTPVITPGMYFMVLTGRKSKKKFSQNVVITD